jgi:exosortase
MQISEALFMSGTRQISLERILPVIVFGALWYLLIRHVSGYWATNPQYSFGWFGPLICAYLFVVRWIERPGAETASSRVGAERCFWIAAFALLPTWLIVQPNPDWRLMSWLLVLEIVILSLSTVYFLGGKSWLRHFAFAVCFILTTLPWPGVIEEFITQGLMQLAAAITVACLNLLHIPALQHGNLVEVATGLLGIDEACSGVRSLQATLMVSLFFGEFYRVSVERRLILVVAGALIAFICNVGRTFLLCYVAAQNGAESLLKWHDPAGYIILSICFFALWGFAYLLSGTPPKLQRSTGSVPTPLPRRLMSGLAMWLIFTIVGVEVWYRTHETSETLHWSFEWPTDKEQYSDVAIKDPIGDQNRAAKWTESDGRQWTVYFSKWAAGPPRSRVAARLHRPENCLPAIGYKLRLDRGIIDIQARDLTIPFHGLEFDYEGQPVQVFFCLWQDRSKTSDNPRIRDHWDDRLIGLESVILGERNLGQQVLEIVMFGYATSQEAEAALRRRMGDLVGT